MGNNQAPSDIIQSCSAWLVLVCQPMATGNRHLLIIDLLLKKVKVQSSNSFSLKSDISGIKIRYPINSSTLPILKSFQMLTNRK